MSSSFLTFFDWKGFLFLGVLGALAAVEFFRGKPGSAASLVFSFAIGSAIAGAMFAFVYSASLPGLAGNPFLLAPGIVLVIALWKFLFGPWGPTVKAGVLGTFLFWIGVRMLDAASPPERIATLLAAGVALIPAMIWCILFLKQHREKLSVVLLTFFAGMLSTAPILFYDHIVRKGFTMDFFLFTVTPQSFMRSSEVFASSALTGQLG